MKKLLPLFCLIISASTYGQIASSPPPIRLFELKALKLTIVSVDYKAGIHEVTGYDTAGALVTKSVLFGRDSVLKVARLSRANVSIVTIPFKVRAAAATLPSQAQAKLNNIGFSLNFLNHKKDRYLSTGTKSTRVLSAGFLFVPTVEEISPETTRNKVANKSSQLFLSTGITLSYSYSNISFVFVPLGLDFGTNPEARKSIYHRELWWGFGIGISPRFLGL